MMEQQLSDPRLLTPDFSKPEVKNADSVIAEIYLSLLTWESVFFVLTNVSLSNQVPLQLHTIMLALDAFLEQHARLPNIG